MVDVASAPPCGVPSDGEVRVARSFLTKILRSSMRSHESVSRPHFWNSKSRLTEEEPPGEDGGNPPPVWQLMHEARPIEGPGPGNQNPSTQTSMERPDRPAHPCPNTTRPDSPEPLSGGSAFSCFSGSSSPPGPDAAPVRKTAASENIFFKGLPSETAVRQHPRVPRAPLAPSRGWDRPGPWGTAADPRAPPPQVRPGGVGPVWQVPERRAADGLPVKVFPSSDGPAALRRGGRAPKTPEPAAAAKDCLHPGKLIFSRSSTDLRPGRDHRGADPDHHHPRQRSDETPHFHPQPQAEQQSVASYYRSLQDINATAAVARTPTAAAVGNGGPVRYPAAPPRHGFKTQMPCAHGRDHHLNLHHLLAPPPPHHHPDLEPSGGAALRADHRGYQKKGVRRNGGPTQSQVQVQVPALSPSPQTTGYRTTQDPWVPQLDPRISPAATPFLHSLARESRGLVANGNAREKGDGGGGGLVVARQPAMAAMASSPVERLVPLAPPGSGGGVGGAGLCRRPERYASTLRHQIQEKRTQLQKSRSAVTLTCGEEEEEEAGTSSSTTSSSSNTYKDHLKEAQARVLQATSFQRRDLEPAGPPGPLAAPPRVGGRRRFPLAQRLHSFSEPDKMDRVGTTAAEEGGTTRTRARAEDPGPRGGAVLFRSRPAFPRPVLRVSPPDRAGIPDTGLKTWEAEAVLHPPLGPDHLRRLGTFAEYQATWSSQRGPEAVAVAAKGRYRSAENILDPGVDRIAASAAVVCVHERSRSSPSADFHTSRARAPWNDDATTHPEPTPHVAPAATTKGPPSPGSQPPIRTPSPAVSPPSPSPSSSSTAAICSTPFHGSAPSVQAEKLLPLPRPGPSPPSGTAPPLPLAGGVASEGEELTVRKEKGPGECSSPAQKVPVVRIVQSESSERADPHPQTTTTTTTTTTPSTDHPGSQSLPGPPATPSFSSSSTFFSIYTLPPPRPPFHRTPTQPEMPGGGGGGVEDGSRGLDGGQERDQGGDGGQGDDGGGGGGGRAGGQGDDGGQGGDGGGGGREGGHGDDGGQGGDGGRDGGHGGDGGGGVQGGEATEDAKREELARDIVCRDRALAEVLDRRGMRTTMDLMEGLFPQEQGLLLQGSTHPRRRGPMAAAAAGARRTTDDRPQTACSAGPLVPSSSYYSVSAPKAELLIKMKDMRAELEEQEESEEELDADLVSRKRQLIVSLARKLGVLREARLSLLEDVEQNEALGREVEAGVQRLCPPGQLERFRMFVGDLDKVVSLLLSLSGRLARVENALGGAGGETSPPPEEKRTLTEKRAVLLRQREDARDLRDNLERRERLVSRALEARLDAGGLDDYRHFVRTKAALAAERRTLEDRVKLGEEQLRCLMDSLPPAQRPLI